MKLATESPSIQEPPICTQCEWFGYRGGTFTAEELQIALERDIPLTLDIAIPGSCLNDCIYCGYYAVNPNGKLSQDEIKGIFKDFKSIGGKSIKILGEGEPLLRKDIFELLGEIKNLGMTPVLFTCGDVIGNHELAYRIHGISGEEIAFRLSSSECTVMLKFEAYGEKQDCIVRRKGYSQLRDRALRLLMEAGLNRFPPTRLGFGIVLLRNNLRDVEQIYRFSMENTVYPLICPIMPIGKMKNKEERDKLIPNKERVRGFHKHLCEIRKNHGINVTRVSDFPGGLPCDISRAGFYIDDAGNALICESDDLIGNIRESNLKDLWEKISRIKWEKYGVKRRLGLCFPKRGEGII